MSVGNLDDFVAALSSGDPNELYEAWLFFERVEAKRKEEPDIGKKLAEKRLKILTAARAVCPPDKEIVFFGNWGKIDKIINLCQKEMSDVPPPAQV
ncbi:MAG: hypothetical protein PHE24_00550 [Patescibacteria group bacterium]|nr:hypothetical protein [Patescibacteria group bacterium]